MKQKLVRKLTPDRIAALPIPESGRVEYRDHQPALYVRVTAAGSKSWLFRRRVGKQGQPIRVTLGPAHGEAAIPREGAVTESLRLLQMTRTGTDPRHAKRQAEKKARLARGVTWEAVVDRNFLEYAEPRNRSRACQEAKRFVARAITPTLRGRRMDEIDRSDIKDLIGKFESRYRRNAAVAQIRAIFNWAHTEEIINSVPSFKRLQEKVESRDRYLSFAELRAVWRGADDLGYPFGDVYKVLMLTGQRRGETANAKWASIDLDKDKLWRLSAAETKAKREHLVPLSGAAIELLRNLPRIANREGEAEWVFTTTGYCPVQDHSGVKSKLDKATAAAAESAWRAHDIRRSVATYLEDALGFAPHLVGAILNHSSKSYRGVTAVYTRGQLIFERRRALTAWARLLAVIVSDDSGLLDRVETILRPETEADASRTEEFRRTIANTDEATWQAYLANLRAEPAVAA